VQLQDFPFTMGHTAVRPYDAAYGRPGADAHGITASTTRVGDQQPLVVPARPPGSGSAPSRPRTTPQSPPRSKPRIRTRGRLRWRPQRLPRPDEKLTLLIAGLTTTVRQIDTSATGTIVNDD
jgi:hypothetical protein